MFNFNVFFTNVASTIFSDHSGRPARRKCRVELGRKTEVDFINGYVVT